MTQRIFKATDPQDVKDLFDLFDDCISKAYLTEEGIVYVGNGLAHINLRPEFIKIDWDGLTEIHRPVDYEKYIGKLGVFWDALIEPKSAPINILNAISGDGYCTNCGDWFDNFRPLTLKEIQERKLI